MMARKLQEEASNSFGDKYELYQTGKSFLTIVHRRERSNKRASLPAETIECRHNNYVAALNSKLRSGFNF